MSEIRINDKISYIKATENPLSADVGIIRDNGITWLYDVGSTDNGVSALEENCNVVLSHFHRDHTGNIDKIPCRELFVSKETQAHVHCGTIVDESITMGNIRIFPIPSSHVKGCLGLEIGGEYAFVGDALYCKRKGESYIYNVQLLQAEIEVLKKLRAPLLLVSHHPGMIRKKADVIEELEDIFQMRTQDNSEIII